MPNLTPEIDPTLPKARQQWACFPASTRGESRRRVGGVVPVFGWLPALDASVTYDVPHFEVRHSGHIESVFVLCSADDMRPVQHAARHENVHGFRVTDAEAAPWAQSNLWLSSEFRGVDGGFGHQGKVDSYFKSWGSPKNS